jgi:dTDP-4-dehydrorhamnose 3,5-epimerase
MYNYEKIVKDPIKTFRRQWHADGRGKLIEGMRNDDVIYNDNFGQVYTTTVLPGRIKAWHMHEEQTDRMMLIRGLIRFVGVMGLAKSTEAGLEADTRLDLVVDAQDPYMIVIPPQLYHGFQNLGDEEAYIINIPDKPYNYDNPDEKRIDPHGIVDFPWKISLDG